MTDAPRGDRSPSRRSRAAQAGLSHRRRRPAQDRGGAQAAEAADRRGVGLRPQHRRVRGRRPTPAPEVVNAANTMAFLGGTRLVLVHHADAWQKADKEVVAAYLASPAPDACLALVAEKLAAADLLRDGHGEARGGARVPGAQGGRAARLAGARGRPHRASRSVSSRPATWWSAAATIRASC